MKLPPKYHEQPNKTQINITENQYIKHKKILGQGKYQGFYEYFWRRILVIQDNKKSLIFFLSSKNLPHPVSFQVVGTRGNFVTHHLTFHLAHRSTKPFFKSQKSIFSCPKIT